MSTKTNFQQIYKMQKELDEAIFAKAKLDHETTFSKRNLAFIVELGELANEIREFKFWSVKGPSKKATIIEEYIDGTHFLTSLGLSVKIDTNHEVTEVILTSDLTKYFLELNKLIIMFHETPSHENYLKLFSAYLGLGALLEISNNQVMEAYILKNKINHERQENNY